MKLKASFSLHDLWHRYGRYVLLRRHHWSYFSKYSGAFTEKCSISESELIYYFLASGARSYILVQAYICRMSLQYQTSLFIHVSQTVLHFPYLFLLSSSLWLSFSLAILFARTYFNPHLPSVFSFVLFDQADSSSMGNSSFFFLQSSELGLVNFE